MLLNTSGVLVRFYVIKCGSYVVFLLRLPSFLKSGFNVPSPKLKPLHHPIDHIAGGQGVSISAEGLSKAAKLSEELGC